MRKPCCVFISGRLTLRIQALKAVEAGQAVAEVDEAFGVAERMLCPWLARFAAEDPQGLKNQPKTGHPPKLDGEEMAQFGRTVPEATPQQLTKDFTGNARSRMNFALLF